MTLRTSSDGDDAEHAGDFLRRADVSIDLMRPCATVQRKILPYSMPGSRIRWVYSARPVTFSRAFEARHRAADLAAAYRICRHRR